MCIRDRDLIDYIKNGENSDSGVWKTNIFGKSVGELMDCLLYTSERFSKKTPADYEAFCSKEAEWLDEYTLFMALKAVSYTHLRFFFCRFLLN